MKNSEKLSCKERALLPIALILYPLIKLDEFMDDLTGDLYHHPFILFFLTIGVYFSVFTAFPISLYFIREYHIQLSSLSKWMGSAAYAFWVVFGLIFVKNASDRIYYRVESWLDYHDGV